MLMTLKIGNNLNNFQTFKGSAPVGLSSLNAAYIRNLGIQAPKNAAMQTAQAPAAQYTPSVQAIQTTQMHSSVQNAQPAPVMQPNSAISNPMPAYMPGVGSVPS